MIEPDRKLAWSGLFLGAVIAAELAVLIFIGPANHSGNAGTDKESYNWIWESLTSAVFWTAAFTVALTISTAFLWGATRRAAEISERALIEHERPWIFRDIVTVGERNPDTNQFNNWVVSVKWKNVGKAPALMTDFVFAIQDVKTLSAIPNYAGLNTLGVSDAMPAKDDAEHNTREVGVGTRTHPDGKPIQ